MGLVFHNRDLERLHSPDDYTPAQVHAVAAALEAHGTLRVEPLPTGLYAASSAGGPDASGYRHVWVRDNVYVALALWRSGEPARAAAVARGLLGFYGRHRRRFEVAAVAAGFDARDVISRPHVRFDGLTLQEIPGRWAHAQNDALGYCLWLAAMLAARRVFTPTVEEVETLQELVGYLEAIRFWDDEDSGHWEETRKISASSIGAVDAGLRAWRELLRAAQLRDVRLAGVTIPEARMLEIAATALIDEAGRALVDILPAECTQPSPRQQRRYDAALLFLVHPLGVVHGALADRILADVHEQLEGAVGIRRYPGDSYWTPDYERRVARADRTRDYSDDIEARDALLDGPGREAQWCVFDPMLSALYGERRKAGGTDADRARQVAHFNRALAQVTGDWACPELYYERDGVLVPNPHTPLLWTQANLRLALTVLRETAG
jgi:phosphorylase kinase alpha/beta subunit